MIFRQMPAGCGKPLRCSHCASSRDGTNFGSARSVCCRHWQLLRGAGEMLLENPSGITLRLLPPSARIHSLIHESVSRLLSQPVTLLKTIHLMFKPSNGLWPSPLLSVVGMTFQQGTCLRRGLAGKIWLCWGFGPRWPGGKEQESFILRRGFRFYFYGSKVTCMHKVFKRFQHAALSLYIVVQATRPFYSAGIWLFVSIIIPSSLSLKIVN